jgi:small subunit ribosomal protein S21
MAIRIKARAGESAEQMMRRFKKMCEKEGLTKDIKRRAYYEKPSEKKQRALRKTIKRVQSLSQPMPVRSKSPRGSGGPGTGGPGGGGGSGGRSRG